MRGLVVLLALTGLIATARAQPVAEAKQLFDAGNAHYAAGRYEEALRAFTDGYAVVPNPKFLLNMGQTYRKLGRLQDARASLLEYMSTLAEGDPRRADVARVVAELDLELHGAAPSQPPPPVAAPPAPIRPPPPPPPPRGPRVAGAVLLAAGGVGVILGGALVGVAVHDDDQIAHPPAGAVFDPSLYTRRDTFYPAGLSVLCIGVALVGAGAGLTAHAFRHR